MESGGVKAGKLILLYQLFVALITKGVPVQPPTMLPTTKPAVFICSLVEEHDVGIVSTFGEKLVAFSAIAKIIETMHVRRIVEEEYARIK